MNTEDLSTKPINFIRFHGLTLLVVENSGVEYVQLKPLSDLAGIDWRNTKTAMLEPDSVQLFGAKRLNPAILDAVGGDITPSKNILHIRLDRARMYLARINTARMRAHGNVTAADYLLTLQIEWAAALHQYETNGVAIKVGRGNALRELLGLFKVRGSVSDAGERKALDWLIRQEMQTLGVPDDLLQPLQRQLPLGTGMEA